MTRIALVVSDVDGTLLTKDKILTDKAARAVRQLEDSGVGFTVVSSRPTIGMRFLVEPLRITMPIGSFNGSSISDPQMNPIEQHLIPASAAQRSIDVLNEFGVDIWLFTHDKWLVQNADAEYNPFEKRTIKVDPVIVDDFAPYLSAACKIVGSTSDAALLQRCEAAMQSAVGTQATRRPLAKLLSRHHATRLRQGHLRAGDGQTPGHFHRCRRHGRRHAQRPRDVSEERPVDRDGQRDRRYQAASHPCHDVEPGRGVCRGDGYRDEE